MTIEEHIERIEHIANAEDTSNPIRSCLLDAAVLIYELRTEIERCYEALESRKTIIST